MALRVSVICRNWTDDRVIPRYARLLRDRLGWTVGATPAADADVVYLLAYFEWQGLLRFARNDGGRNDGGRDDVKRAAYFTHLEEEPPGNAKAKLWDEVAQAVDLRVAMCQLYARPLSEYGLTVVPPLPVDPRFQVAGCASGRSLQVAGSKVVVGLSGYTYSNHRKGEDLVRGVVGSKPGQRAEWRASGRGWPVPTKRYDWAQMPAFYQGLDVLVCPSRVEGGPMPVLEALACGVRVVMPTGVGILDEIPQVDGIFRYERGDLVTMVAALEQAMDLSGRTDAEREGLHASVSGFSEEAFVEGHRRAFEEIASGLRPLAMTDLVDGGVGAVDMREELVQEHEVKVVVRPPVPWATGTTRGIYCVAFGEPARASCLRMMTSAKLHMPDIPIALCAASAIGPEDVLITEPDSDVGGRRAKLKVYENAPAEWQTVLYLDADTEVVAPIYPYFEWIEDGWDLAICQDIQSMETLHIFERKATKPEVAETLRILGTAHTLQYNGGAWAFARNERTEAFFYAWRCEWERWAQRDQGALLRALHTHPLKVWVLGNEWNTFPKFQPGLQTAGLLHFPGDARRWGGAIPGRIDGAQAWEMVKDFERKLRIAN